MPKKQIKQLRDSIKAQLPYHLIIKDRNQNIKKFVLQQFLGGGSFGIVFSCGQYAVKIMLQSDSQYAKKQLKNEIKVMSKIKHQNVVRLYQYFKHTFYIDTKYGQQIRFHCDCFIMERCSTDLTHLIKNFQNSIVPENIAIQFLRQMLKGYKQLFNQNIIHRDLKPDNVLAKNQHALKIADFGLSRFVDDANSEERMTMAGTPYYMSPQACSRRPYSSKADVWSFGIIFYEMLNGDLPWKGHDQQQMFIMSRKTSKIRFRVGSISENTKYIIEKMLAYYQKQRISCRQLFEYFKIYTKEELQAKQRRKYANQQPIQKFQKAVQNINDIKRVQNAKPRQRQQYGRNQSDNYHNKSAQKNRRQNNQIENYNLSNNIDQRHHRRQKQIAKSKSKGKYRQQIKQSESDDSQYQKYENKKKQKQRQKQRINKIQLSEQDIYDIIVFQTMQTQNENLQYLITEYAQNKQDPNLLNKIANNTLSCFNKQFKQIGKKILKRVLQKKIIKLAQSSRKVRGQKSKPKQR